MRAVLCDAFEGIKALNLFEAVEPYLAADELMIDVHAASVSYMDYLMTCGGSQLRPALPYIPGTDAAVRGGKGIKSCGAIHLGRRLGTLPNLVVGQGLRRCDIIAYCGAGMRVESGLY